MASALMDPSFCLECLCVCVDAATCWSAAMAIIHTCFAIFGHECLSEEVHAPFSHGFEPANASVS